MSTTPIPSLTLNDGHTIPRLGFRRRPESARADGGGGHHRAGGRPRHIDTAAAHRNEAETGAASGAVKLTHLEYRPAWSTVGRARRIRQAWLHGGVI